MTKNTLITILFALLVVFALFGFKLLLIIDAAILFYFHWQDNKDKIGNG